MTFRLRMNVLLCPYSLGLTLVLITTFASVVQADIPRETRADILSAVVEIRAFDNELGLLQPWSGSGVIISPDGYIVTNYHVVGDDISAYFDHHHAVYTIRKDRPYEEPRHTHWAKFVTGIADKDLALLKIYERKDRQELESDFPSIPIGNAHDLIVGDELHVVGFPGISGPTITLTSGQMSGWLGEDQLSGGRSWIKTDTRISSGNSGGAALNDAGELIGIPTLFYFDPTDQVDEGYIRPINIFYKELSILVKQAKLPLELSLTRQERQEQLSKLNLSETPKRNNFAVARHTKDFGKLEFGQTMTRVIAADNPFVYHMYELVIPEDTVAFSVQIDGHGRDLDLAVHFGEPIFSYDKVDFLEDSRSQNPFFVKHNPDAGTVFIEVMNFLDVPAQYSLEVSNQAINTTNTQEEAMPSGLYGIMPVGHSVNGIIAAHPSSMTYHTYIVTVPEGLNELTINLTAEDEDIDLAVNQGQNFPDTSYSNVDFFDKSSGTNPSYTISNPEEGLIYIDVLNFLANDMPYTLSVTSK